MNAAQRPATPSSYLSHQKTRYGNALPGNASERGSLQNTSRQAAPSQAVNSPLGSSRSAVNNRAPKRVPYAGARQAIAVESAVKLTVNLLLAIIATTTIAKLVPHYQSQQARLDTLQTAVTDAERRNAELRSQFDRNFDPAQAGRIMQEQSGMAYPNQKQIIWTESVEDSQNP